jgi:hypothetical protein
MRLFFVTPETTVIADRKNLIAPLVKDALLENNFVQEVSRPEDADAIILRKKRRVLKNLDTLINYGRSFCQ